MTSLAQLLLTIVVTTLTFFIALAGVQVFQIFLEFRSTLKRVNKILDNTQTISESAAKPLVAVNEFFTDVKTLVKDTETVLVEETQDKVITPAHHQHRQELAVSGKRFFRRSGQSLRPS